MRSISGKVQWLTGAAFIIGLAVVLVLQTYLRLGNTWNERMDANMRIVKGLAAPARNAITLKDKSQVLSYMELLSADPRAAGIVLASQDSTMMSQQSISHFDLDIKGLERAARIVEMEGVARTISMGDYEYVAVPVTDPALRPIGAIAVAWDTKGLLNQVWRSTIREALSLFALALCVLLITVIALRKLVTVPLASMAALLQGADKSDVAKLKQTARTYQTRSDEIGAFAHSLERFCDNTTERLKISEELDGALSSMTQGLCMFDADGTVVVSNSRFGEMYNLPPGTVCTGWQGRYLIRTVLPLIGMDDDETDGQWLVGGFNEQRTIELANGSTYTVSSRKAPNGGWVVTHTDVSELKTAERQLLHLARHDPLTNLPNRRRFRELIDDSLFAETGEPAAILFLDLDKFKYVNDTMGHAAGDELLRVVSARLLDCVRSGDIVCRLGGDEFAILQHNATAGAAEALARRVKESLSQPISIGPDTAQIGVSIGIALSPVHGTHAPLLLQHADMAVYQAKRSGRNRHVFFNPELAKAHTEKQSLEKDLRQAIASGNLELHYQPIVDATSGRLAGVEALVRWNHPVKGLLSPDKFIPMAEETGLIVEIGDWVLCEACRQSSRWPANAFTAVNISPIQIRRPDFAELVFSALAGAQMRPGQLHLEITEGVMLADDEVTLKQLDRMRQFGVQIVLDDFGTGQSTFGYLQRIPVSKIKIDRSFVTGLPSSDINGAVVDAIVSMSRKLGVRTVAEGVETEQDRLAAERYGIDELQGYLVCPPVPPEKVMLQLQNYEQNRNRA